MINIEQIGFFLPQGYLFKDVSYQINKGDRIGLTGKNGAGKSTMLKLISKLENPSDGKIHYQKDVTIGFLTQDIEIDDTQSVFDYLFFSNQDLNFIREKLEQLNHYISNSSDYESSTYLKALDDLNELNDRFKILDGFQWEEKITSVLKGLGFDDEDFPKILSSFSGGWKMRAELARILVNKPSVLLLDEPTNHLDIISIAWLENYLQRFEGAVVLISHDRLFLDNVTNRTIEITLGKIMDYPFAFSTYLQKREEELERLEQAKKQQDKDIKHTQELIDKFRAKKNKAAFAQSLIKKLERTDVIEIEKNSLAKMAITFPLSVQPGKWVLELQNLGKTYADKVIFKGINITVGRQEKIALLGPNGVGKSTLLKRILNQIDGEGTVNYGHQVEVTYFAQNQVDQLDPNLTIYETVDKVAIGEIRKNLRGVLGSFLFSGEDVDKKVAVLSGGEKTRLALCQLLLSPSNFLILDEPTNHLDIQSKEVLKNALKSYEGTFIIVSHDREFLDGLTNRIWDIENKGLTIHHYGVREYLEMKMHKVIPETKPKVTETVEKVKPDNGSYEEQKERKRKKNTLTNQIKKSEEQINALEQELNMLDETIANMDYSDKEQSTKLLNQYAETKQKLDFAMHCWEQQMEELDTL